MAKLELVEPKHPVLHVVATTDPFDDKDVNWESREQEMFELMERRMGVGLASPQIGSSHRMFVMTFETGENVGIYNPEILEFSDKTIPMEEGCLTFPLLYFIVTRPEKVKVKFQTNDKQIVEDWLEGRDARCFLHEFDHLQGKLFLEYTSDMKLQRAMKKREKTWKTLQTDLALQKLENES